MHPKAAKLATLYFCDCYTELATSGASTIFSGQTLIRAFKKYIFLDSSGSTTPVADSAQLLSDNLPAEASDHASQHEEGSTRTM